MAGGSSSDDAARRLSKQRLGGSAIFPDYKEKIPRLLAFPRRILGIKIPAIRRALIDHKVIKYGH